MRAEDDGVDGLTVLGQRHLAPAAPRVPYHDRVVVRTGRQDAVIVDPTQSQARNSVTSRARQMCG